MNFLALFFSAFLDVSQTILTKKSAKSSDTKFLLSFSFFKSVGAFATILLLIGIKFSINLPTIILGTVYGLLLLSSMCTSFIALNCGSMAITAIVISYSVIIPFLFGAIVLHEPIGFLQIIGLVLILISSLLLNFHKSGNSMNKKWAIYTFSCFITNGLCSIVQKIHQTAYPGQYCKEFMIIAFGVIAITLVLLQLVKYSEVETKPNKTAMLSGVCTGGAYLLTLKLSAILNATVLFPTITICSAALNCLASRIVFKEHMRKIQFIAIIIGIVSVIFITT